MNDEGNFEALDSVISLVEAGVENRHTLLVLVCNEERD